MNTKVFVENLPAATTRGDLMNLFAPYGDVADVSIAADRDSHPPPGFGFVTMVTSEGARAAIQGLHGRQVATRTLLVMEVRPPSLMPPGRSSVPQLPGQYHRCNPNLKKNGIIPTAPGRDDGKGK